MSGSLSARQSRTNQPPGSDAVAVSLALARPTTEWHQHIQNRRSDPCIAAQISRGPTGMGRPRCRVGAGGVLFVSGHARSPGCFCGGVWVWVVSVSDIGKAPWGVCSKGLPVRVVRRRATLPHPVGCSTIAVPGLSFRVRNGTGRLTWAMAAANLLLYGQTLGSAGLWRPGNRTADADMSMFRLVARQCSLPSGVVCRRKMRSNRQGLECQCCLSSVSTGRLHPSRGFHVRPIDHVFCMGTTGTRRFHGMLILEQASRLDAFSGYPFRT
jgi:hypothetical protein